MWVNVPYMDPMGKMFVTFLGEEDLDPWMVCKDFSRNCYTKGKTTHFWVLDFLGFLSFPITTMGFITVVPPTICKKIAV